MAQYNEEMFLLLLREHVGENITYVNAKAPSELLASVHVKSVPRIGEQVILKQSGVRRVFRVADVLHIHSKIGEAGVELRSVEVHLNEVM